jgi:hypothetical protein
MTSLLPAALNAVGMTIINIKHQEAHNFAFVTIVVINESASKRLQSLRQWALNYEAKSVFFIQLLSLLCPLRGFVKRPR